MAAKPNTQEFTSKEVFVARDELDELLMSIDAFMDLSSSGALEATISVQSLYFVLKPLREKTQGILDALS